MTEEQRLQAQLDEARAKLEQMKRARSTNIRVSEKGAVSVYGLGRFPVTLYADQWRMLISLVEIIEQFLLDHESQLARKVG